MKSAAATVGENFTVKIVYDFPVAAHLCDESVVRYVRLVRRGGRPPEGSCARCKILFQYRKPKPSKTVRHVDGEGIVHF